MKSEERQTIEEDAGLLRRLQNGETAAFDVIFEKHRRGVFSYVRGMVNDNGLAEDIVQECFLELVKNIARIKPEQGAGGWLYRVARNRAIDVLRARKNWFDSDKTELADKRPAEELADERPTPSENAVAREREANVRMALEMLPPKERDILLLRYFGDLKFNDIAKLRRRPLGTVLWQATRSLEKIRLLLTEQNKFGNGEKK
ncbi:MAG: sigma-70 family RNA polymerase sigma factor [bacterium]